MKKTISYKIVKSEMCILKTMCLCVTILHTCACSIASLQMGSFAMFSWATSFSSFQRLDKMSVLSNFVSSTYFLDIQHPSLLPCGQYLHTSNDNLVVHFSQKLFPILLRLFNFINYFIQWQSKVSGEFGFLL